jgi:hypothetical protein
LICFCSACAERDAGPCKPTSQAKFGRSIESNQRVMWDV